MKSQLVATLAGDSGDGVQLLGKLFSDNVAQLHFSFQTLPDFPAEIRAPAGTISGVSGFQIQWGNIDVLTAGHLSDVFIAFNVAGLIKYKHFLKPETLLIYDPDGFDIKNIKKTGTSFEGLDNVMGIKKAVPFTKLTLDGLSEFDVSVKEKNRNKNILALGYLLYGLGSSLDKTNALIENKFGQNDIAKRLFKSLHDGFYFAETTDFTSIRIDYKESALNMAEDIRPITGNKAIALALVSAIKIFNKPIVFSGYPITPASDILHELAKYHLENLIADQAEDEIAAVGTALGASYAGSIGVTATSGPGFSLKQETISLALMAELPLLIIDVQRAGPSTGMPTKVEQADLNLAIYGRHGDSRLPVVSIKSPNTAYNTILDAIEIMLTFQTPIVVLSDSLVANSSQLWKIPEVQARDLSVFLSPENQLRRNEDGIRAAIEIGSDAEPVVIGGLEKDIESGQVSYTPSNHQKMTELREHKLQAIQKHLPEIDLEPHSATNGGLIISWGSSYGSVSTSFQELINNGITHIAHLHLEWISPLPKNFLNLIEPFDFFIVPEINNGQLCDILRKTTTKKIYSINEIKGMPFFSDELTKSIQNILQHETPS